jgi:hypothetical protein
MITQVHDGIPVPARNRYGIIKGLKPGQCCDIQLEDGTYGGLKSSLTWFRRRHGMQFAMRTIGKGIVRVWKVPTDGINGAR